MPTKMAKRLFFEKCPNKEVCPPAPLLPPTQNFVNFNLQHPAIGKKKKKDTTSKIFFFSHGCYMTIVVDAQTQKFTANVVDFEIDL